MTARKGIRGFRLLTIFLVLGLLGLVAAIFIPSTLVNRAAGRDAAARDNMKILLEGLMDTYRVAGGQACKPESLKRGFETYLLDTPHKGDAIWADKNPWDLATPGFSSHIKIVSGLDREGVEEEARNEAVTTGKVVFALEEPGQGRVGYLAAAVRQSRGRYGTDPIRGLIASEVLELPAPNQ